MVYLFVLCTVSDSRGTSIDTCRLGCTGIMFTGTFVEHITSIENSNRDSFKVRPACIGYTTYTRNNRKHGGHTRHYKRWKTMNTIEKFNVYNLSKHNQRQSHHNQKFDFDIVITQSQTQSTH
jgi:hypothetical protein